jgi:hypothetical protein
VRHGHSIDQLQLQRVNSEELAYAFPMHDVRIPHVPQIGIPSEEGVGAFSRQGDLHLLGRDG